MFTCPIPCLESSPTSSHMPKPNASKNTVFKTNFLFSKTYYRVSVKFIGQLSKANMLDNPSKQFMGPFDVNCWTISQYNSPENIPSKFLSQHFRFCFLSCHALIPNFLGCPSAYGMQYPNSKIFMLIYFSCIY